MILSIRKKHSSKFHVLYDILLCIGILVLSSGCTSSVDESGTPRVTWSDNPATLPYRVSVVQTWLGASNDIGLLDDFSGDGELKMCMLCQNWKPEDSLSALIWYSKETADYAEDHVNVKTTRFDSYDVRDIDGDSIPEIAVAYKSHDTIFFQWFGYGGESIPPLAAAGGIDRDSSGAWDGSGHIGAWYDFNADGFDEVLLGIDAGYDLYPRELVCLDWHNRRVLWQFPVSGTVSHKGMGVFPRSSLPDSAVFFGVSSKGNSAVTELMDDLHSYVVALDVTGGLLWLDTTGDAFATATVGVVQCRDDRYRLFATYNFREHEGDTLRGVSGSGVQAYSLDGEPVGSVALGTNDFLASFEVGDVTGDGYADIVALTTNGVLAVIESDLTVYGKYRCKAGIRLIGVEDYLNRGDLQILAVNSTGVLLLLDAHGGLLARWQDGARVSSSHYARTPLPLFGTSSTILLRDRDEWGTLAVTFVPNGLLSRLYNRYRQYLTVVAAALLAGLLVTLYYRYRAVTTMRTIARQKDELQRTHGELARTHQALKDAQRQLVEQEKYRQARDIAGGVAHEIRNALFPARSWLSRLKSRPSSGDSIAATTLQESVVAIEQAVARAIDLTDLVNQYSSLKASRLSDAVRLSDVIDEVIRANGDGLDSLGVDCRVTGLEPMIVHCNRLHLFSVFNNLMRNALEALTEVEKNRTIEITGSQEPGHYRITFIDSGAGIEAKAVERVFDMFYSTKPTSGTGVGLALARAIMTLYGGSIEVVSTGSDGTVFEIRIPSPVPI